MGNHNQDSFDKAMQHAKEQFDWLEEVLRRFRSGGKQEPEKTELEDYQGKQEEGYREYPGAAELAEQFAGEKEQHRLEEVHLEDCLEHDQIYRQEEVDKKECALHREPESCEVINREQNTIDTHRPEEQYSGIEKGVFFSTEAEQLQNNDAQEALRQLEQKEDALEQSRLQLSELRDELSSREASLKTEEQSLREWNEKLSAETEELRVRQEEVERREAEIESYLKSMTEKDERIMSLESEIAEKTQMLHAQSEQSSQLQLDLESFEKSKAETIEKFQQEEERLGNLSAKLHNLQMEIEEKQTQLELREEQLEKRQREFSRLAEELEERKQQITEQEQLLTIREEAVSVREHEADAKIQEFDVRARSSGFNRLDDDRQDAPDSKTGEEQENVGTFGYSETQLSDGLNSFLPEIIEKCSSKEPESADSTEPVPENTEEFPVSSGKDKTDPDEQMHENPHGETLENDSDAFQNLDTEVSNVALDSLDEDFLTGIKNIEEEIQTEDNTAKLPDELKEPAGIVNLSQTATGQIHDEKADEQSEENRLKETEPEAGQTESPFDHIVEVVEEIDLVKHAEEKSLSSVNRDEDKTELSGEEAELSSGLEKTPEKKASVPEDAEIKEADGTEKQDEDDFGRENKKRSKTPRKTSTDEMEAVQVSAEDPDEQTDRLSEEDLASLELVYAELRKLVFDGKVRDVRYLSSKLSTQVPRNICSGLYENAVSSNGQSTIAVAPNGDILTTMKNPGELRHWHDMVSVCNGDEMAAGLKEDGTVEVGLCTSTHGKEIRREAEKWEDIEKIALGPFSLYGVKSDGTIVIAGEKDEGSSASYEIAMDREKWQNIVSIGAGFDHVVGLRSDGTVIAIGYNSQGQCNVDGWNDIIGLAVGETHTVGLKRDGTVLASGNNDSGQCSVYEWKEIIAVAAGGSDTVGLKADGSVVVAGSLAGRKSELAEWKDIVAVSVGNGNIFGVNSDGSVLTVGDNSKGQCNVKGWKLF